MSIFEAPISEPSATPWNFVIRVSSCVESCLTLSRCNLTQWTCTDEWLPSSSMQGGCWMREEQHDMIHLRTSERPALAVRTARNGQQGWARRRSGRHRKPFMQCNTLSFLRMRHMSSAADARESLRSLIQGSGRLFGRPSASKYVRIRIFGKLSVHAFTGLVLELKRCGPW